MSEKKSHLKVPVYETKLRNVLYKNGLTIYDLQNISAHEFAKIRRVGAGLFNYTVNRMKDLGLSWGMQTRKAYLATLGERELNKEDVLPDLASMNQRPTNQLDQEGNAGIFAKIIEHPEAVNWDQLWKDRAVVYNPKPSFDWDAFRNEAALRIYCSNSVIACAEAPGLLAKQAIAEADELIRQLKGDSDE